MKSVFPPLVQVRQAPQPNASRPQQPPKVKPAPLPKCLQCDRQSGHASGISSKCRFPGARGRASTTVLSTSPTTVLVTSASCALSSETTTCTPTAPSENTIISTTSTNSGSLAPRIAPGAPRAGARKHRHAAKWSGIFTGSMRSTMATRQRGTSVGGQSTRHLGGREIPLRLGKVHVPKYTYQVLLARMRVARASASLQCCLS